MRFAAALCAFVLLAASAEAVPSAAPHYDIHLTLDPEHGAIAADLHLQLPSAADEQRFLLGGTYVVSVAEVTPGASVEVTSPPGPGAPQTLVVHRGAVAAGQALAVHLVYAGALSPTDDLNAVSPTRLELSADSLWYPLSTNFNTRVTADVRVEGLPTGFVPISVDRTQRRRNGFTLHRTTPRPDIAFAAAPGVHEVTRGALHFFTRDPHTSQARNYIEYGPRAVRFFESLYGPLPGGRVVVAIVDRQNGVGYSRPGYVVVADVRDIPADNIWAREGYIAHEISHNYWSNADFTGEDYWLVESTAEYSALRFIEAIDGVEARQHLLDGKQARATRGGPILGAGRPSDDAVYAKGPILLFALEQRIGRPHLERVLASLARRDHITTQDFLDALAREAGQAEATAFEAQLRQ